MKKQTTEYSFLVRNAAPITLFLVGLICVAVGFVIPEEWRPFEPVEDARWFDIYGVFVILLGAYFWKLCNLKK